MSDNNLIEHYYHYTYKIEFETGHLYFGSRSCRCLPEADSYLGSPCTHKNYWSEYTPIKKILSLHKTREEANEYENILIEWSWSVNKSLSLNGSINGIKFHNVGRVFSEEFRQKISKHYYLVSPEGVVCEGVNLSEFARQQNLNRSNLVHVTQGKRLHDNGWTANLFAHRIYIEAYKSRGIHFNNWKKLWQVEPTIKGNRKAYHFKTEEEAINYRDRLEVEGHKFKVTLEGWQEKVLQLTNLETKNV